MKIITRSKNSAVVIGLIILMLAGFEISVEAQKNASKKQKTVSKNRNFKHRKIASKTISAGVLNGKAVKLVKPEFPLTAKAVNTYGIVAVNVLIDETGSVVEATATSGHLFLRPAAVKAALASQFAPVTLSGTAVRVRGVIIYKFLSDHWNWLEIGFALAHGSSYYSVEELLKILPNEFEAEKQFLSQFLNSVDDSGRIIETVTASIKSKIGHNAKSLWLLETGTALSEMYRYRYHDENSQKAEQTIRRLLLNVPAEVSPSLIFRLNRLVQLLDTTETDSLDSSKEDQIYRLLTAVEEFFPELGK